MWIATTTDSPLSFGTEGKFWFFDANATKLDISLPDRANITTQKPSFTRWTRGGQSRAYINGSATDNLVFTEHMSLVRLGIEAPTGPLVNTASPVENQIGYQAIAGGGLTGSIIPYIRFYDSLNGRRSPLSGPGAAITLTNQGLELENVPAGPDSPDVCVTHVEVWVSQDGGLPRFWFRRDVGAPTISGNVVDLGEAEVTPISLLPRCKYNTTYHDRLTLAGDDRHPDRVYFSAIGEPEQYEGFYISTRQGEPVIGLFVVRDTLIVQCPGIHYYVQGYTEDDIQMQVLEPYIGGLGHHTLMAWNDQVAIPGTIDWYICNGTSMTPLGVGTFDSTWRASLLSSWPGYQTNSWGFSDTAGGVLKLCAMTNNVAIYQFPYEVSTYWILDLRNGKPSLMFDTRKFANTAGAQLALPGTSRPDSYTGDTDGNIWQENYLTDGDGNSTITHILHTSHAVVAEPADPSDVVRFQKAWTIMENEVLDVGVGIYAGNEYAWRQIPQCTYDVPAQLKVKTIEGSDYYLAANDRGNNGSPNGLTRCSGSSVSMRFTIQNNGPSFPSELQDGPSGPQKAPFTIKGWGCSYSLDGENFRGEEVLQQD